jgi:two-component system cell cycle sensor histidine kinase/response regulator CckA
MKDQSKTKQVLIQELVALKQRISELEHVYEALRVSEQRMRLTLEGTDQGLWDLDLVTGKGKITYSDNWRKILGYGPEESRFDYEWWINQVHPESRPSFEKALLDYMSGHTKYLECEYQIRNKSGEWKWVQAIGIFTESDKTGSPVRMSGTLRDITERKKLEETLRASEEKYRLITENMVDCVALVDKNSTYQYVTPSYRKILGYSPEDIIGITGLSLTHPDDLERITRIYLEGIEHGWREVDFETRSRHKDGHYVPMEVRVRVLNDSQGKVTGGVFASRDISRRKKMEEVLRESEEKYRLIAENMADFISILDMNLRFTYISPSIIRLRGLTVEEAMEETIDKVMTPESLKIVLAAYEEEMKLEASGKAESNRTRILELEEYRKDGSTIWVESTLSYLRNKDNRPVGILATTRDITQRKRAEEELQAVHQRFEDIIEFLPDATFVINSEKKIIAWNKAAENMTGMSKEAMLGRGDSAYSVPFFGEKRPILIDLLDRPNTEVEQMYQSIHREGTNLYAESFIPLLHDGRGAYLWGVAAPLFDSKGNRSGAIEVLRDVTARKRAEQALRDSEEKYRRLFESTSDVVYSLDTELRVVSVSPSVERHMGYAPDELVGKFTHDLQILLSEDLERGLSDLLHALKGETVHPSVYRFVSKNGELIYGEISGAPIITDGKITGVICVARDITARKQAEDALRISEDRLRLIAKNAKVVIWMMDMNLRYTYISPYIKHNMDYTPEEYVLKPLHEVLTPSSLKLCMQLFDKELEEEKNPDRDLFRSRTIEVEHIHRDGRIIWAEFQMTFIRDTAGNAVGILGITSEITERKHAEEALKLSEVTYREIFNTVNDAIWVHDIETGKFLDVNNTMTEMFGYSVSEALNMNVEDISSGVPPFIQETAMELFRKAADGQPQHFEWQCKHKDGHLFWTEVNLKRAAIAGKECVLAIERDITKRKIAEEALRESEEKYRELVKNAPAGIYEVDYETNRFTSVNDVICEYAGYTRDKMLTMNLFNLFTEESQKLMLARLEKLMAGEKTHQAAEYCIRTKGGEELWVLLNARYIYEAGKLKGATGVVYNITDRRNAEHLIQQSEKKFRDLAELLPQVVFEFDLQGRLTYVNRFASDLFGYSQTDIEIGLNAIDMIAPADRNRAAINIMKILKDEMETGTEYTAVRKNGKEFPVIIYSTPIHADKKVVGLRGIVVDITDRKQAEEEKRSLEERLNRAEKMEALGQLAGGVAHDLNNVLGILSGYSEMLLLEIPEGSRSRGHAEKILQSTEKGAAIIDDLLTLARRSVVVSDVINLNSLVSDFIKTPVFESMKDYHPRVTFRTEYDKNLLNIKASPVHLEKTLMNLVSNAAESISGMGEVTIRTESRYLDKPLRGYDEVKEGDYAVLTVSDTGMGIPAENREKIFEPFYTKKTMGRSGTGLGLAIVWGTVKDHNGYIDIQTEVGEGTTFTLFFPVTRVEMIAPQQKEPMERYMGRGESVLVVDDIAEQRDVAASLLTRLGYNVRVVSSGEEAVEYLKQNKADILVLDMIMAPGIDGLETYERVLEINPKQKAILVSGFSETERAKKAQKLGAGAYVKKPYIMEKIGFAIQDELNR